MKAPEPREGFAPTAGEGAWSATCAYCGANVVVVMRASGFTYWEPTVSPLHFAGDESDAGLVPHPSPFNHEWPPPAITSLDPATAVVGGAPVTVTVHGSGFDIGAVVEADEADQSTTRVSDSELTYPVDPSTATAGEFTIRVRNSTGVVSNSASFTITEARATRASKANS